MGSGRQWLPLWGIAILLSHCGCRQDEEMGATDPAPKVSWFNESAMERGIDFTFQSGHSRRHLMPEIMAGGAALFDMDNDGDLDAYLVQGGKLEAEEGTRPGNQLYRNRGDGRFDNVTPESGAAHRGYGMGVASGDYDNDGDTDLYVTNVGPNVLLRNENNGRFADVTAAAQVGDESWGASAAFVDYDADGDLDLFATNYVDWSMEIERDCPNPLGEPDYCYPLEYDAPTADLLYRNNGDGTFVDVSADAGLSTASGNGLGVVCGDFDGDSRPDIFVANDSNLDHLWLNQGNGTFVDQALLRGCALDESGKAKAGMGVSAIDIDDDSTLDLLVVNLRRQTDSFFLNRGEYFTDATAAVGLVWDRGVFTRFGVGILDFDNDGLLDLYLANGSIGDISKLARHSSDRFAEPNLLFRGKSGGRFEEVVPRGGTEELLVATSRAAAFGDVDNDGGVDVLVVNRDAPAYLLHNLAAASGNWMIIQVLNEHGSDALGAVTTLQVAGTRKTREVRTAYSYLAANDPRIHLGLGREEVVSEVAVRWPDGHVESFGDFAANQIVTLRRGKGMEKPF